MFVNRLGLVEKMEKQNPNDEYSETFSGTNSKMLTTTFLLVIIIGAVGLYFAMKPKLLLSQEENAAPVIDTPTPITGHATNQEMTAITTAKMNKVPEGVVIEFSDLLICDYFDEDMCVENVDKKIKRGNTFYVYENVSTTNPTTITQVFDVSLKIEDDNGDVVFEQKNFDDFVVGKGNNVSIPVKVMLYTFKTDPLRKETATYTFQNKYTKEKIEKKVTYELI